MKPIRASYFTNGLLIAACCATLFLLAWIFAQSQTIWVDETTQLVGLKLGPVAQMHYLLHGSAFAAGVPYDRMPPLSYWMGWLWSQCFGGSEISFRLMGITAVAVATAVVAWGGLMMAGRWGLVCTGMSFALAANVITAAGEIRAYPLFLCFSAIATVALIGFAKARGRDRNPWLIGMIAASLLATYSHFFGLMLGGAMLTAAWVTALRQGTPAWSPVIGGILFLALSIGIAPFVAVAFEASEDAGDARIGDAFRTLYRLVGHPAASVDLTVLVLLGISFAAIAFLALWRGTGEPVRKHRNTSSDAPAYDAIPISLATGLSLTFIAGMVLPGFDAYRPSYSAWAIPGAHLLIAIALARTLSFSGLKIVARSAAIAMLAAQVWIASVLTINAETFSHGPHRILSQIVQRSGRNLHVLHEQPQWAWAYFPLRYEFGRALAQSYHLMSEDGAQPTKIKQLSPKTVESDLAQMPVGQRVLVVTCQEQGQADLRNYLRGTPKKLQPGPLTQWLASSPEWRQVEEHYHFSYVSAYAVVFEKVISGVQVD